MSIQFEEVNRLRKVVSEEDRANCKHEYHIEMYLGTKTGDYACKKCGKDISEKEYKTKKQVN